jgi:beta-glucosidase
VIPRSQLNQILAPDSFLWATGIEDTFITAPWPATGRTLDEYELTGHYERWREDIDLMASLGVQHARYGIPWHRVNPEPARWDWQWADRPLERLLEVGINPIVDLVHYGLPDWLDGAFLDPDYHKRVAEYAARLAGRYAGKIRWYTPLNEPRITAWYCGRLGWWPPFRRGWRGFVEVMLAVCRGIVTTEEALRAVDPEMVLVHVDATDLYQSDDPTLQEEVSQRQEIVFLALDLIAGRVTPEHRLWRWLIRSGADEASLVWFLEQSLRGGTPDILGLNMYPMFSLKRLVRQRQGARIRMPYAGAGIVSDIVRQYAQRYTQPLMISETASRGPIARRRDWLDGSVAAVRDLRASGVPIVGYTWWPMFALVAWAYRQGTRPVEYYLEQMGLWDLEPEIGGGLRRVHTPLVERFQQLVAGASAPVGVLHPAAATRPVLAPPCR